MITLHKIRRINNTLLDYFIGLDEKDWDTLEKILADKFVYDNTTRIGGDPLFLTPKQFRELYEKRIEPVTSHTQTSTYRIHLLGQEAKASCYFISYQYWKDAGASANKKRLILRTGTMKFHLFEHGEDWKIDLISINIRIEQELQTMPHGVTPMVTLEDTHKFRHPEDREK